MSIITLQFGQCGNQIGQQLYNVINDDISNSASKNNYCSSAVNKWFTVDKNDTWEPRSILIDTENKVVDGSKYLTFKFKNVVAKAYGGSANNWAFGYNSRSKLLECDVLDRLRTEIEKCDFLTSVLSIFSSSGGTGSGVGSCIGEQIRDEYPKKHLTNAIVLPFNNGEIVTQSYNSLLSLSTLYPATDSTILFENERLHHICKSVLNLNEVTFKNINSIIAEQLAGLFQPLPNNVNITSLIKRLTSHPSFKYVQITSEPQFRPENLKFESVPEWKPLIQSLAKQSRYELTQQSQSKLYFKKKFVTNVLITRGGTCCAQTDVQPFKDYKMYVSWLPLEECFHVYHQPRKFKTLDKYLLLASNSNSICTPLNLITDDAWKLFTHSAYLHHYKKYDVDEDYFLNMFQTMENILDGYKKL